MGVNMAFQIFGTVYLAVFGLLVGSFLNVCIYRIPEGRTVVKGHSMCMSCGHTLAPLDLVPLFSWIFLRGKCRYCSAPVSSRYAKIEALTAFVFAAVALSRRQWLPGPDKTIESWPEIGKLIILLAIFSVLIVQMMIQKDRGIGRPGVFVVITGLAAARFVLLFFEPDRAMDVLISAVTASAICVGALMISIWLSPEKLCTRLYLESLFRFSAFREYFSSGQKALRISDGVHAATCLAIGFYPAIPGLVAYSLIRIFVPWEKSIPYLGMVTALSSLIGILMPVSGVFV